MATSASTAKATSNGRSKVNGETIEEQVGQLRDDIQALARTIGTMATGQVDRMQAKAGETKREAEVASEQALEAIRTHYKDAEATVSSQVREKPLQALGIAAGIGFLFALLAKR
ncbi:MAG: DNA gyrase subunit B [Tepidamorphaceae bacterium]|nr:DUF883 family protein [Rhodobiaceae bacterium]MCC0049320.1 DUF883 family protein [Rhodobiaceae bacterium]